MSREGRKKITGVPRNAWETMLEESDSERLSQAGEVEIGFEDGRGGGDKGLDIETGSGGYGGDAVAAGIDEADGQPNRPLDAEIIGDPRTRAGSSYAGESQADDDGQSPIGDSDVLEEDEDESDEDYDEDEDEDEDDDDES